MTSGKVIGIWTGLEAAIESELEEGCEHCGGELMCDEVTQSREGGWEGIFICMDMPKDECHVRQRRFL